MPTLTVLQFCCHRHVCISTDSCPGMHVAVRGSGNQGSLITPLRLPRHINGGVLVLVLYPLWCPRISQSILSILPYF